MSAEIRRVREDELAAYFDAMSTGFLFRPDVPRLAEDVKATWDLERVWAAFDDGRIRGTFRSWPTELTVPGGATIAAAAITNVTVVPTHRRRGLMRGMTLAEHDAVRERGEVAALLYAAEYPIYGRFGYGPACTMATWTLDTRGVQFRSPPSGTIGLAKPGPDARDALQAVYEAHRPMRAGEIRR